MYLRLIINFVIAEMFAKIIFMFTENSTYHDISYD